MIVLPVLAGLLDTLLPPDCQIRRQGRGFGNPRRAFPAKPGRAKMILSNDPISLSLSLTSGNVTPAPAGVQPGRFWIPGPRLNLSGAGMTVSRLRKVSSSMKCARRLVAGLILALLVACGRPPRPPRPRRRWRKN